MATISTSDGRKRGFEEEGTINVASKKVTKARPNGQGLLKAGVVVPQLKDAGDWRNAKIDDESKKKKKRKLNETPAVRVSDILSPMVELLHDKARVTFDTGRPLDDPLPLQHCKHCKKVVTKLAASDHIAQCLRLKKEKAQRKKDAREARERAKEQAREEARKNNPDRGGDTVMKDKDDNNDDISPGKKGKANQKMGGKKRKADGDADKGPKPKKKKDDAKIKAPKPKGPVDVERQCGVEIAGGQRCARSLTCKSHSMGAKRAVPGRSLPYDMLLAAWQKSNQAKQQKAALNATAPLHDDDDANAGPVDSEEETAAVMAGLGAWKPQPIVPHFADVPLKMRVTHSRLRQQIETATNGGRINIFAVSGIGAQKQGAQNNIAQHFSHSNADPNMEESDGESDGESDEAMSVAHLMASQTSVVVSA